MSKGNEQTKKSARYVALRDMSKALREEYNYFRTNEPAPYLTPDTLNKIEGIGRLNKELGIAGINKIGNTNGFKKANTKN